MWQYRQTPNPDELFHSRSYKYVEKIGEGKDAKYFYSQQEYAAYLKGKKSEIKNKIDAKAGMVRKTITDAKNNIASKYKTKLNKNETSKNLKNKEAISNAISNAKSTYHDAKSKVNKQAGKYYTKNAIDNLKNGNIDKASQYAKKALSQYSKLTKEKLNSYKEKGKNILRKYKR